MTQRSEGTQTLMSNLVLEKCNNDENSVLYCIGDIFNCDYGNLTVFELQNIIDNFEDVWKETQQHASDSLPSGPVTTKHKIQFKSIIQQILQKKTDNNNGNTNNNNNYNGHYRNNNSTTNNNYNNNNDHKNNNNYNNNNDHINNNNYNNNNDHTNNTPIKKQLKLNKTKKKNSV